MPRRRFIALAAMLPAAGAFAQSWPERPIKLVIPGAAGLSIDFIARMIGERLGHALGQPVIVENRPGARGFIANSAVAKSPPDGYTLVFNATAGMSLTPQVVANAPVNLMTDLVPVIHTTKHAFVLVTSPQKPYRNLRELIEAGKAQPGKIAYASLGAGSAAHVWMALFNNLSGTQFLHVPYVGAFLNDVMSGVVDVAWEPTTTAVPLVNAGRLRALAVSSKARSPVLPDIPAVSETFPGYEGDSWHAIFAPVGTPPVVVARLNTEIVKVLKAPDIEQRLRDIGVQTAGTTPAESVRLMKSDYDKWGEVIRRNNIHAD